MKEAKGGNARRLLEALKGNKEETSLNNRQELGRLGEKLAGDYLKKKGYRIREQNYQSRRGEIDIIGEKGGYLVFVEVRAKRSSGFGSPEESITPAKKARLTASALSYLNSHENLPENWRIDLVAIEFDAQNKVKRLELIENIVN